MKLSLFVIIYFICIINSTFSRIVIEDYETLPKSSQKFINDHQYIEVQSAASQVQDGDHDTFYFKLSVLGRNKRKAYDYFIKRLKILVQKLAYNLLIPNRNTLIQSPIQVNFNNKKRIWQFHKNFALRVTKNDKQQIQKLTSGLKLTPLKYGYQFKDQLIKWSVMDLFNSIKLELHNFIQNKYNGQVTIKGLNNFEIKDFFPCKIESQFSPDLQLIDMSQENIKQRNDHTCNGSSLPKNLMIKAKFIIGLKSNIENKFENLDHKQNQIDDSQEQELQEF